MQTDNRIVAFTGHRPSKLPNGWDGPHTEVFLFLVKKLLVENRKQEIERAYTGGALGWDQIALEACYQDGIRQTLVEPFPGFWRKWSVKQIEEYMQMKHTYLNLEGNDEIVHSNPDEDYAPWKLHARNEYMVNRCTELWAWWDGTRKGGTFQCVKYAHKQGKKIVNVYKEFHCIS